MQWIRWSIYCFFKVMPVIFLSHWRLNSPPLTPVVDRNLNEGLSVHKGRFRMRWYLIK